MSRRHSMLAGVAGGLALTLVVVTLTSCYAENGIVRPPLEPPVLHEVKVSFRGGLPVVEPDSVTASASHRDVVYWTLGDGAENFAVTFKTKSPFFWSRISGTSVVGTVRARAYVNNQRTDYKYSVTVNGIVLDPMIIIER